MIEFSQLTRYWGAIREVIDLTDIVTVLTAVTAGAIALVFLWWGIRKVVRMLMSAFRSGKLSV